MAKATQAPEVALETTIATPADVLAAVDSLESTIKASDNVFKSQLLYKIEEIRRYL